MCLNSFLSIFDIYQSFLTVSSRLSLTFSKNLGPIHDINLKIILFWKLLNSLSYKYFDVSNILLSKTKHYLKLIVGKYWLKYIRGTTGKSDIQASSSWWVMATRDKCAHLSAVILLSVEDILEFIACKKHFDSVNEATTL